MPSPAEDPRIGTLVEGRYRILEAMAAGSMGVVYRGERVPVGKAVAIKFLHAAFAADPEFIGRFERETRVMSRLAHPHCVSVLDFGVSEGAPYLVMDFVAGTTLRDLLDDGPLPPARALALARQIVAGLAHAHEQGIVHRDIKPANIMVTEEIGTGPHVRILDFGLARLRGAMSAHATQSFLVVGTPSYMAPEQTVGGAVDARADLYAAGVVLYEMLTGERPFVVDDTLALMAMHRSAPVPRLPEGMAPSLQRVIDRAMAKDPDDRYTTAIELAAAIDDVIDEVAPARRGTSAPDAIVPERSVRALRPDVGRERARDPEPEPSTLAVRPRRSGTFALLAILALAGVATAYVLVGRDSDDDGATPAGRAPAPDARRALASTHPPDAQTAPDAARAAPVSAPDAASALAALTPDADVRIPDADVRTPDADVRTPDANVRIADTGNGTGSGTDAGSGSAVGPGSAAGTGSEAEPDPTAAEDPDPAGAAVAAGSSGDEGEAPDAPTVIDDTAPPPAPVREHLASSIHDAVVMIQQGKRELALSSLRALWPHNKASAYVPFLLGNLYFDKRWWSVSLDHYRAAISKNHAYRKNTTLNRNVIRMLASPHTRARALTFIRRTIGRAAAPYVKYAARHDPNPTVRKRCATLARSLR